MEHPPVYDRYEITLNNTEMRLSVSPSLMLSTTIRPLKSSWERASMCSGERPLACNAQEAREMPSLHRMSADGSLCGAGFTSRSQHIKQYVRSHGKPCLVHSSLSSHGGSQMFSHRGRCRLRRGKVTSPLGCRLLQRQSGPTRCLTPTSFRLKAKRLYESDERRCPTFKLGSPSFPRENSLSNHL